MKKIRVLLSVVLIAVMLMSLVPISAFGTTYGDDFLYSILSDGTVKITKYQGTSTEVIIPSKIAGKDVSTIGTSAFYIDYGQTGVITSITSIDISEGVKTIESGAFVRCTSLKTVIFPGTLSKIEEKPFWDMGWGTKTILYCGSFEMWREIAPKALSDSASKLSVVYDYIRESSSLGSTYGEFDGHEYKLFNESITWSEAKKICENIGGHLLTINSEREQRFVETLLENSEKMAYFIGGEKTNAGWQWITKEDFVYTNWAPGEPNYSGNYVQILSPLFYDKSVFGKWDNTYNDGDHGGGVKVSSDQIGYICEWDTKNSDAAFIKFGADRFSFGEDITGYVGSEISTLLVYNSEKNDITSLDIISNNPDVAEIGTIEIGVGDYIAIKNEHMATVQLKLKSVGTATITVTSPEGLRESININVNKKTEGYEDAESIVVFSTDKSLSVKTGESLWLAFGLMNNKTGEIEENWRKMAVVVSDQDILSLSAYSETEYGYSIELIGKKEGSTNVIISDYEKGISRSITVSVYDNYTKTYSYSITDIGEFYPNNEYEKEIKTNIYNLNGLYVNNYHSTPIYSSTGGVVGSVGETPASYKVTFDVYNSRYYNGAVDVYDADGVWIDSEYIDKYSDITSLRETGEQLFFLIHDAAKNQLLSYQSSSFSKKTTITVEVPQGGYFTISNNMAESPGTFFANTLEILYDTTSDLLDFATSKSSDKIAFDKFYKEATKSFAQNVIDAHNESLSGEAKKRAMEAALSSLTSEINTIQKKLVTAEAKDFIMNGDEMYSALSTLAENVLNSYSINWKHLYQSATGAGESLFVKFAGPAGAALKGMFAITKGTNKLLMAAQMSRSLDNTYATVYSSIDEGFINPYGVFVDTNGNVDSEAVLQVFKVSDSDSLEIVLNSDNPLEKYELYHICFVKDDELVGPSGKVKVYIPIPEGMNKTTCKIYRQEQDGSWTILEAHVEENYLVFETDHFSLYSIVGEMETISIVSLPKKIIYKDGDLLDTSGLALEINGQTVLKGFICEPTYLTGIGLQTITVKYGHASTEFFVTVSAFETNPDSSVRKLGDLSGDGKINSVDYLLLKRCVLGTFKLTDEQFAAADINRDNKVNSIDYLLLKRHVLGTYKIA